VPTSQKRRTVATPLPIGSNRHLWKELGQMSSRADATQHRQCAKNHVLMYTRNRFHACPLVEGLV
jgi:hypothetical protein